MSSTRLGRLGSTSPARWNNRLVANLPVSALYQESLLTGSILLNMSLLSARRKDLSLPVLSVASRLPAHPDIAAVIAAGLVVCHSITCGQLAT